MKKLRELIAVLLIVIMVFCMMGCSSDKSQIKDTLSEFENSCRNLDVDGMLDCIDPDVSDPIRLGMAVLSNITGTDYESIIACIFSNISESGLGDDFNPQEFLSTIGVSDAKLKINNNTATVTCELSFEVAGEKFERDAAIDMVKKDDKWYIAGFDML